MFLISAILVGTGLGLFAWWMVRHLRRKAEELAAEEAAQAARDMAERQRPIEERLRNRGYGRSFYVPPPTSAAPAVTRSTTSDGFDPLMAGVIGYAIGSMNSGSSHSHSAPVDDTPAFSGAGGDTAGSGSGGSWSDDSDRSGGSSSSDSGSSSSSDSGSSDSGSSSSDSGSSSGGSND